MRTAIRIAGFVALAAAAVGVWVVLAPKVVTDLPTLPSATQYESLIQDALDAETTNAVLAESAPQQQVVNGWVARDLLTIIAKEQADLLRSQGAIVESNGNLVTQPFDDRVPALLMIAVLAICWAGISAPRPGVVSQATQTAPPAVVSEPPPPEAAT